MEIEMSQEMKFRFYRMYLSALKIRTWGSERETLNEARLLAEKIKKLCEEIFSPEILEQVNDKYREKTNVDLIGNYLHLNDIRKYVKRNKERNP